MTIAKFQIVVSRGSLKFSRALRPWISFHISFQIRAPRTIEVSLPPRIGRPLFGLLVWQTWISGWRTKNVVTCEKTLSGESAESDEGSSLCSAVWRWFSVYKATTRDLLASVWHATYIFSCGHFQLLFVWQFSCFGIVAIFVWSRTHPEMCNHTHGGVRGIQTPMEHPEQQQSVDALRLFIWAISKNRGKQKTEIQFFSIKDLQCWQVLTFCGHLQSDKLFAKTGPHAIILYGKNWIENLFFFNSLFFRVGFICHIYVFFLKSKLHGRVGKYTWRYQTATRKNLKKLENTDTRELENTPEGIKQQQKNNKKKICKIPNNKRDMA